jgi:hypothetical protein
MVLPSVVLMVLRKAQQSVVLLALQLALLSVLLWAAPMALQMVPLMVDLSVRSWGQILPIHLNCRSRGGAPAASSTSSGASCNRGVPVQNSDTTRTLLGRWSGRLGWCSETSAGVVQSLACACVWCSLSAGLACRDWQAGVEAAGTQVVIMQSSR